MGHMINKHHSDELDGTRGAWRVTFQAKKSSFGPDGHAQDYDEGIVMTCPGCGGPFGVGFDADGPKIDKDGVTDRPVKCMARADCSWISDGNVTFDKHQEAEVRAEVNEKKAKFAEEVQETRIRTVHERVKAQMEAEIHERAMAQALKIVPRGDPDQAKKLVEFMKTAKNIG